MTWFLVVALMAGGNYNFGEPRLFRTQQECMVALEREFDLYVGDGISLNFVRGGCYHLAERSK